MTGLTHVTRSLQSLMLIVVPRCDLTYTYPRLVAESFTASEAFGLRRPQVQQVAPCCNVHLIVAFRLEWFPRETAAVSFASARHDANKH